MDAKEERNEQQSRADHVDILRRARPARHAGIHRENFIPSFIRGQQACGPGRRA